MPIRIRIGLTWVALLLVAACSVYGIQHQRLFHQDIWTHAGLIRFLVFAAGFTMLYLLCAFLKPGLFPLVAIVLVIVYTAAAAGPVAPLIVVLVLLSAFALGDSILRPVENSIADAVLGTLLGLALYMFVLSIAAHWRLNYRPVYLVALALPWTWNWRRAVRHLGRIRSCARPLNLSRTEQFAAVALAFVLAAHWLVALQPEVGPDALAVHLAVPDWMAWQHRFSFDVSQRLWAVMPMGGDWYFTLCYMLGGEEAARLFNFALLLGIVTLLGSTIRRWLSLAPALFLTALFAATPLVQLVTGSLFVENLWALLCFGALIALDRYRGCEDPRYLYLAFALLGAAGATKFGALAFLAPAVLLALWISLRNPSPAARWRQVAVACLCFAAFAAPPYVSAYVQTGSPVFPYMARMFPSRFPALAAGAGTLPPGQRLGLRTPFDLTFHTSLFYEVQDGAAGFQYFLFLPLGVLLLRRKWPPLAVWSGIASALFGMMTLAIQPDVRYLYPALAPATLFFSAAFADLAATDRTFYRAVVAFAVAIFFLDLYFLPSSGWMHKDFVRNPASKRDRAAYLTAYAPERNLIADMNRNHPGASVAFFESTSTAGLRAPAFTSSWHTAGFNNRISTARSVADCFRILQDQGIQFVIAPRPDSGIPITTTPEETFLRQCTTPAFVSGKFYAGAVKNACGTQAGPPAIAGEYDDLDPHITFEGLWSRGRFAEASNGTLTWSNVSGGLARLRFQGTQVTYVYTKAFNRGLAEVFIDGQSKATLDLYSPAIGWKTSTSFQVSPGTHTLEIRVTGRKSPAATGAFVDVDAVIVR